MEHIKLNISRLQYPMENLSIPRGQKNKNETSPIRGEQKKAPFKTWNGNISSPSKKRK